MVIDWRKNVCILAEKNIFVIPLNAVIVFALKYTARLKKRDGSYYVTLYVCMYNLENIVYTFVDYFFFFLLRLVLRQSPSHTIIYVHLHLGNLN